MNHLSVSAQNACAPEQKKPIHLGYIDGLRGIASFYVVMHHFCLWGTAGLPRWAHLLFGWTLYGHFAVAVFITLSGFCLMLPVSRSSNKRLRGGFRQYIKRRAWRILPPYYAALILSIIILLFSPQGFHWLKAGFRSSDNLWLSNLTLGSIVSHLLVVHNLSKDWSGKLDMAMWSIATEWQIYFLFPLVLLPVWRRYGNVSVVAVGFALGMVPHLLLPMGRNFDWACPWYLGLFALGMIVATMSISHVWTKAQANYLPWITLTLGLLYLGMKFLYHGSTTDEDNPIEWIKDTLGGMIAASVILYCAAATNSSIRIPLLHLLENKVMVGLGTWSYSLYLVHCLILREMQTLQSALHLSNVTALLLRVCVGVPLALLTAYLFFLIFERPFLRSKSSERANVDSRNANAEIARDTAVSPAP